jgi:hypothetical protein
MPEVLLFGEDVGHAAVLQALVERLAGERGIEVGIQVRRARWAWPDAERIARVHSGVPAG